jgi:DNA-binding XRE family transcriptional regulator
MPKPQPLTPEAANRRFAENLRRYRERAELTQEELADAAGLHRTAISFLERAAREPRMWTLITLARALRIRPGDLLDGIR